MFGIEEIISDLVKNIQLNRSPRKKYLPSKKIKKKLLGQKNNNPTLTYGEI